MGSVELTIVIPTYNRSRELARLLMFLSEAGNRFPILILDGSSEEHRTTNEALVRMQSLAAMRAYDRNLHLGKRLADGLAQVSTPYVVICADDDFVFPYAAEASVRFLANNPDYSVAMGWVKALYYSYRFTFFRRGFALLDVLEHGRSLIQESFLQRILYYCAYAAVGYVPLFYGVRRTAEAVASFNLVTEKMKYSSMELLNISLMLLAGKAKILPMVFGLRDYSSATTRDPERDDPVSYLTTADLDYIGTLFVDKLTREHGLHDQVARYIVDMVRTLPWGKAIDSAIGAPCRMHDWGYRAGLYLQSACTIFLPAIQAQCSGIDRAAFSALRKAHVLR